MGDSYMLDIEDEKHEISHNGIDFLQLMLSWQQKTRGDEMSLVQFNKVYKQFAGDFILKDISFSIEEKDKIGLVGLNGVGKSTIIRMLLGKEEKFPSYLYNFPIFLSRIFCYIHCQEKILSCETRRNALLYLFR